MHHATTNKNRPILVKNIFKLFKTGTYIEIRFIMEN